MQHDVAKVRIGIVVMRTPVGAAQIDFDVAGQRRFAAELYHGSTKIGPWLTVPDSRVEHLNGGSFGSAKLFPVESLMKPDGLKEIFRWGVCAFSKCRERISFVAPLCVSVELEREHLQEISRAAGAKSSTSLALGMGLEVAISSLAASQQRGERFGC